LGPIPNPQSPIPNPQSPINLLYFIKLLTNYEIKNNLNNIFHNFNFIILIIL